MPKVSIIMPTFNRGWIIQKALNSVISQNFKDFELVVVNDGSTDNTKEILSKLDDNRITVKTLGQNRGVSAARNEGLRLTKGELVTYLDSDNIWYPNFLEVMVKELTPEYVLVFSSQNTFVMGGNKDNPKIIARKVRDFNYNPAALSTANHIDINAVVHRKNILDEVGNFDDTLKTLEDWDLFARIAIKYPFKIKHVSQVLGEYYFYLKETAPTSINSFVSDDTILDEFGIWNVKGDREIIVAKLKKLLEDQK